MVKCLMQKYFFHNGKSIDKIIDDKSIKNKSLIQVEHLEKKKVVDINKLLNRVKIQQKNESKKRLIFYSSTILILGLIITFITIIK